MKLSIDDSGRLRIEFEDEQDREAYKAMVAEMQQLMPKLMKVWEKEPRFLTKMQDCTELMRKGGQLADFHVSDEGWLTDTRDLVLIRDRKPGRTPSTGGDSSEREGGRPLESRTVIATMRLLSFAPYEVVLEEEKKWRRKRYLEEVRDKGVAGKVKDARKRAVRDANMCVARAQKKASELLAEYVRNHPESLVPLMIWANVAHNASVQLSRPGQREVADSPG